jgi:hypothetical protein
MLSNVGITERAAQRIVADLVSGHPVQALVDALG